MCGSNSRSNEIDEWGILPIKYINKSANTTFRETQDFMGQVIFSTFRRETSNNVSIKRDLISHTNWNTHE